MCLPFLPLLLLCVDTTIGGLHSARQIYDSITMTMTGTNYSSQWWQERAACMDSISPHLQSTMERAWAGMEEYWTNGGGEGDPWYRCGDKDHPKYWMEDDCIHQLPVEMDIWEPCDYASNLAYDRLMVEMCLQDHWSFSRQTQDSIASVFGIVTFASAFMHGSNTLLGAEQDHKSNDLLAYVIYQAGVASIPYNPVIHDLSLTPRAQTGQEAVNTLLDMYRNSPVKDWRAITASIDIPDVRRSVTTMIGYMLTVLFSQTIVDFIVPPLMNLFNLSQDHRDFLYQVYFPAIRKATSHSIPMFDSLRLGLTGLAAISKVLLAFVWQEDTFNLAGIDRTPEANAFGAIMIPKFNAWVNSQTPWKLYVDDVQNGEGYPGWSNCNRAIPHAKWHSQTAASLVDLARLMDTLNRIEKRNKGKGKKSSFSSIRMMSFLLKFIGMG